MNMWNAEKKIVLEAAQKMSEKGLVVGTAGNVSIRVKEPKGGNRCSLLPLAAITIR